MNCSKPWPRRRRTTGLRSRAFAWWRSAPAQTNPTVNVADPGGEAAATAGAVANCPEPVNARGAPTATPCGLSHLTGGAAPPVDISTALNNWIEQEETTP